MSEAFTATAAGTVNAYLDIAWRGRRFTSEEIHYILVLGILLWATAQFAAYAVYGHRRPLNAVIGIGLALVANMALTSRPQLPLLVVFTGASLFLLIGMHAFEERTTWIRRRIGDPSALAGLYLRGGTVFIVAALAGSLALTTRAAANPLADAWEGLDDQMIEVAETIGRLFPVGGDLRAGAGVSFGTSAKISPQWFGDQEVAFVAVLPAAEKEKLKWRAAAYDRFLLTGWEQSEPVGSVDVAADFPLLAGTPEDPSADLTREIAVEVRPEDYGQHLLLGPGTPVFASRDATVRLGGSERWFAAVELDEPRPSYAVTARVLRLGEEDVISQNRLEAASEAYPPEITARFTDVPAGALGPAATALLAEMRATAESEDPYHLARAFETFLQNDPRFRYETNLRGVDCGDPSQVECFARTNQGYCLHYASTMAILLRAANPANPIPTRLVQGFLPGERVAGRETVRNAGAHAWVEVYFPGYGWIPFDPTGGGVGQPAVIPVGPEVAPASPTPAAAPGTELPDPTRRIPREEIPTGPQGPTGGGSPGDRTLLILAAVVLALVITGIALSTWLRGPRGELSPDGAWRMLSRGAGRLGFAPRPTQTVYEYAATLGELVPVAREDLRVVADAKVETAYARADLAGDRLRAVSEATRRLRLSLLRLVLRRGPRRRRR
jgi:transglutaminase-like putative cysteine protease